MACLESAAFALAISGRPVGAAQLHLDGALCRDDRALEMTKVVANSSSQPMLTVFTYRPTKIQPISLTREMRAYADDLKSVSPRGILKWHICAFGRVSALISSLTEPTN